MSTHITTTCIFWWYKKGGREIEKIFLSFKEVNNFSFSHIPTSFSIFSYYCLWECQQRSLLKDEIVSFPFQWMQSFYFYKKSCFPIRRLYRKKKLWYHAYVQYDVHEEHLKKNENLWDRCNKNFVVKAININILVLIYSASCISIY